MIDYYLASPTSDEVVLEILDTSGEVIRGFTSLSQGYTYQERQEMRAPYLAREGEPTLATKQGHNRFLWDLRHPGTAAPAMATGLYGRPGARGPMVAPGHYQVRLTVGSWSQTRELEVRIDPRVFEDGTSPADLRAQEQLAIQMRDAIAEGGTAFGEIETLREQIAQGSGAAEQVDALYDELVTRRTGSYPPPMLLDQLDYLYGMVTKADGRPSQDALTRYAELRAQLDELLREIRQLQQGIAE